MLQQIVQLTGPRCCLQRRGLESRSTLNYILCHWSPPRWWYDFGWTLQSCLTPSTRMSSFINWMILINWSSEYPCQIRKNNLEHMLWLLMREKLSCEHSSKLVLFRFLVNFILLWVSLSYVNKNANTGLESKIMCYYIWSWNTEITETTKPSLNNSESWPFLIWDVICKVQVTFYWYFSTFNKTLQQHQTAELVRPGRSSLLLQQREGLLHTLTAAGFLFSCTEN